MKDKILIFLSLFLLVISCSKKINKPGFIEFQNNSDSLFVLEKNDYFCPIYVKVEDSKLDGTNYKQLTGKSSKSILNFKNSEIDTLEILNRYKFSGYYGEYPFKGIGSFKYKLPFQKGRKTMIIQGYDGDFSHKGDFSAKCLDFDLNVGDTIVATADGIVIKVVEKHTKQGVTEDFKNYGNYLMLYHANNTFSQYVHLVQNGSLVKVGDSVKANQPIGVSGFTGWTTVPHLHFGVYKPTINGFKSMEVMLDSIDAKTLRRGDIIIKK